MTKRKKKYSVVNKLFTVRNGDRTITFGLHADHELFGEEIIPFAGTSHKSPDDKENYGRGIRISVGSAYRNLGRQILKREYQAMAHQGLGVYNKHAVKEIVAGEEAFEEIEKMLKEAFLAKEVATTVEEKSKRKQK